MSAKREMAVNLATRGMKLSDIAEVARVNVELVRKWTAGSASQTR